ncbi:hypothetical protein WMY93_022236 [Mugilogobius chulae]|uniref:Uncharacterized protein n=1 Tax=Mugilogobius chulae TaxID=88201 RepID=A0AAW0NAR1_9GOBI
MLLKPSFTEAELRVASGAGALYGSVSCPECGSERVVQLADHPAPYSSTPKDQPLKPGSDREDGTPDSGSADREDFPDSSLQLNGTTSTEEPTSTFMTARSSFYIGEGQEEESSPSTAAEELAGSYHYTHIPPTHTSPPTQPAQVSLPPPGTTASDAALRPVRRSERGGAVVYVVGSARYSRLTPEEINPPP